MRKQLFIWELAGFLFTALLGVLLHFTYAWSGKNPLAAAFSAVNESTWEHMKLLFVPVFLFSVIQVCILGRDYPNFLWVRAEAVLAGLALIPILFYTYTGILGYRLTWADIGIFLLADAAVFWIDSRLLLQGRNGALWRQVLGLAVLWGLAFCFVWCTFRPPRIPLWQDPATGLFGTAAQTGQHAQ